MSNILEKFECRFPNIHTYGETEQILLIINKLYKSKNISILDVGCGYGRNLRILLNASFMNVVGVDINYELIKTNKENGLKCFRREGLDKDYKYDVLLMSHIIEHFLPNDLVSFIDSYLNLLKPEGHLIIVTPSMWDNFYCDFDHIKPYYPFGVLSVFSEGKAQVQFYSRNKLKLINAPWIRYYPFQSARHKARFLQEKNVFERIIQIFYNLLFYASKGKIGKPNGWIGAFQKV